MVPCMRSSRGRSEVAREPADDERGSALYGWLLVLFSRPWFRFAFRAAIPIVMVIVVAILVSSHRGSGAYRTPKHGGAMVGWSPV
jgi:hypothetical protein